jgi:hypothetical protein
MCRSTIRRGNSSSVGASIVFALAGDAVEGLEGTGLRAWDCGRLGSIGSSFFGV